MKASLQNFLALFTLYSYLSQINCGFLFQVTNEVIFFSDFKHPSVELDAYSGKVHNLLWSSQNSPQHLFSCGPEGKITWWSIKYSNTEPIFVVTPQCSFILPPSKQRWASAIEIFPKSSTRQSSGKESWTTESVLVACGDRKGSLHLFDPKNFNTSSDKVKCWPHFQDICIYWHNETFLIDKKKKFPVIRF